MNNCPLCNKNNNKIVDKIYLKDLRKLYKKFIGFLSQDMYENTSNEIEYLDKIYCNNCGLFFFSPSLIATEKYYSLLSKAIEYYPSSKDEFEYVSEYISKNDFVFEVGCGNGEFSKYINKNNYIGIDLNSDAIKKNKKKLNVIHSSIEEYSENMNKKYDIVCAFQVLEHILNPRDFIEKCIGLLKKDGLLIFSIPSYDSFLSNMSNHLLNLPPHHQTLWTDKTLINIQKIFSLKLINLYHEKIQDIHLSEYVRTLFREILRKFLPFPKKTVVIKKTLNEIIVNKIASFLMKKTINIFNSNFFKGNGHTVTVIYKNTK